jgi:hypothetical protein
MSDKYVRVVGQVEDMEGIPLVIGVDYHTVTFGLPGDAVPEWRLESSQAEEFAQLFVSACWQAARQAGENSG